MRRFLDLLDKIIIAVLILILSVMLLVGAMQVIWRYVLQQSLSWSEELMRYLYVWATMLGAARLSGGKASPASTVFWIMWGENLRRQN